MKRILIAAAMLLGASLAHAQTYSLFKPANGVLVGSTSTYVTTAATSTQILALWSGSCSSSTFLRGDGSCQAAGGGSPGGSNTQVQVNNAGSFGGTADFTFVAGGDSTLKVHSGAGESLLSLVDSVNQEWQIKTGATPSLSFHAQTAGGTPMTLSSPSGVPNVDIGGGLTLGGAAGTSGQFLKSNGAGAAPSWASGGGGGGSPGGSDTQVQYNGSGSFAADANFVWDYTNQTATITGKGAGFNNALIITGPVNPAWQLIDSSTAPWMFSSTSGVFKVGIVNGGGGYGGVGLQITANTSSRNITDAVIETSGGSFEINSQGAYIVNGSGGTTGQVLQSNSVSNPSSWVSLVQSALSSSIGGGALAAGACASTTVTITGAAVTNAVVVTPTTYPGDGNYWNGYVSSANTITVNVCAAVAGTPGASTYQVRLIN